MARNGVIGRNGDLPWRLPADLKHFKAMTMGKPIVMGRKTWESIGKPLPGRENIVVTRDRGYVAPGGRVSHTLDEALAAAGAVPEIMVIGGAQLYALAMPRATRLYLTRVDADISGDTLFPPLEPGRWRLVRRSALQRHEDLRYDFRVYSTAPIGSQSR